MKNKYVVILLIYTMSIAGYSQNSVVNTYSLEECIALALDNNLNLKSTQLRANSAKFNYRQSLWNMTPSVNGNFNLGVNDGRSIDPFTNDFINQELTFSSLGLSLNATIFNGFRLLNTAKQNLLNKKASEMEIEAAKQDLVLNVTLTYLQVLNSKAVLGLNKARLEVTKQQLKVQEDFYKNESGNPADYNDILGQLASDETSVLSSQSSYNNAKLSLSQILNLNDGILIEVEDTILELEAYGLSSEEVFKASLENLATFKAQELRLKAAKKGVSIAKSQFTPEVSVFAGVNSNYSSAAQIFNATGTSIVDTGDFVNVNGQDFQVQTERTNFDAQQIDFSDQLDNNLNTVVGVSVRVPLLNGFRAKNNVALEKINVEEGLLELERTNVDVKNTIAQVHFDMEAAYNRYQSLQRQVEAYKESYRINEIRFNSGLSNFLNYITSKNNLDNAKVNLSNAKYDYLLRVKVLDFYSGNAKI